MTFHKIKWLAITEKCTCFLMADVLFWKQSCVSPAATESRGVHVFKRHLKAASSTPAEYSAGPYMQINPSNLSDLHRAKCKPLLCFFHYNYYPPGMILARLTIKRLLLFFFHGQQNHVRHV